jgi:hypothetical protein
MLLAHRIRLDPTPEQVNYFGRACGTARRVWSGYADGGIEASRFEWQQALNVNVTSAAMMACALLECPRPWLRFWRSHLQYRAMDSIHVRL